MDPVSFIIVVVCGFGIGILSGMFGIGGGGLIVPLLHMAFGLPMIGAASTSLLTIAPTGISGSIKHIRQKTISLKTGLLIGGFGAIASVLGSFFSGYFPEYAVVIITVVVILFSVGMMVRTLILDRKRELRREQEAADAYVEEEPLADTATELAGSIGLTDSAIQTKQTSEGSRGSSDVNEKPEGNDGASLAQSMQRSKAASFVIPMIVGLIAGGIAGIVGVGGGFIIVPFCVSYLGFSLKQAAGTSLISIAIIAVPGIVTHAILGHIWWLYGLAIIIGTIPGAQLGAWLIAKLPERPMRYAFAALLTLVGIMMLIQEFMF